MTALLGPAVAVVLAATTPRVAVLPFENDTGSAEYEPLRRGLADLVTADLVQAQPVVVLERARLDDVLAELKLQQTRAFDPKTAAQLGKLLGATHVVAGSVLRHKERVALTLRLITIDRKVVLSAQASGDEADLFSIERDAVGQLVKALQAKWGGDPEQRASLQAVTAWAAGVALAEDGKLEDAKQQLATAVRDAPDFTLAAKAWSDVLRRLHETEKQRATVLGDRADELKKALLAKLAAGPAKEEQLGAQVALANLALLSLSQRLDAKKDAVVFVPPARLPVVEPLEQDFLSRAAAVQALLKAQPDLEPRLDDATKALMEKATSVDLSSWDFATPATVAIAVAAFLGSGWTPYRSDVPQFAVRPAVSQRSKAGLQRARAAFEAAQREVEATRREEDALQLANEWAEMLVLLGRQPEAVARWQGFLDAHPDAEDFAVVREKMTAVMGLDEQSETDAQWLEACDARLSTRGPGLATRAWRAKGVAGLEALRDRLLSCAKEAPAFAALAWSAPAEELQRIGACEAWMTWATRAAQAGARVPAGRCGS